jgi:hypothetical protein
MLQPGEGGRCARRCSPVHREHSRLGSEEEAEAGDCQCRCLAAVRARPCAHRITAAHRRARPRAVLGSAVAAAAFGRRGGGSLCSVVAGRPAACCTDVQPQPPCQTRAKRRAPGRAGAPAACATRVKLSAMRCRWRHGGWRDAVCNSPYAAEGAELHWAGLGLSRSRRACRERKSRARPCWRARCVCHASLALRDALGGGIADGGMRSAPVNALLSGLGCTGQGWD